MNDGAAPAERLTSGAGLGAAVIWVFALVWSAATVAAFAVVRSQGGPSGGLWFFFAAFALAGLFLLTSAVRTTGSAIRFRGVALDLQTDPGVLGGRLAGSFVMRASLLRFAPLRVNLRNYRTNIDSEAMRELLWETSAALSATPDPTGPDTMQVPFSIDVPFDAEPTSRAADWRLRLTSRDAKHGVTFIVPVMRTAESSPAQTRQALRAAAYEPPPGSKLCVEPAPEGTTVRFPLPSWTWSYYGVLVLLAAAAWQLTDSVARQMGEDPSTVNRVAIAAAILLFGLPLATYAMTVRSIDASPRGLTLRYVMLRRPKHVAADTILDVAPKFTSAQHYELVFAGSERASSMTIVNLRTQAEADWIAFELRRALGLRAVSSAAGS
jgi:hypothetical protein